MGSDLGGGSTENRVFFERKRAVGGMRTCRSYIPHSAPINLRYIILHCERTVEVLKHRVAGVLVGEEDLGRIETPVDGQRRVGDRDTAVGLRMVVVVTLIQEHSDVGEHCEAVDVIEYPQLRNDWIVRNYQRSLQL